MTINNSKKSNNIAPRPQPVVFGIKVQLPIKVEDNIFFGTNPRREEDILLFSTGEYARVLIQYDTLTDKSKILFSDNFVEIKQTEIKKLIRNKRYRYATATLIATEDHIRVEWLRDFFPDEIDTETFKFMHWELRNHESVLRIYENSLKEAKIIILE